MRSLNNFARVMTDYCVEEHFDQKTMSFTMSIFLGLKYVPAFTNLYI